MLLIFFPVKDLTRHRILAEVLIQQFQEDFTNIGFHLQAEGG